MGYEAGWMQKAPWGEVGVASVEEAVGSAGLGNVLFQPEWDTSTQVALE